jgi:hypothetical protein
MKIKSGIAVRIKLSKVLKGMRGARPAVPWKTKNPITPTIASAIAICTPIASKVNNAKKERITSIIGSSIVTGVIPLSFFLSSSRL